HGTREDCQGTNVIDRLEKSRQPLGGLDTGDPGRGSQDDGERGKDQGGPQEVGLRNLWPGRSFRWNGRIALRACISQPKPEGRGQDDATDDREQADRVEQFDAKQVGAFNRQAATGAAVRRRWLEEVEQRSEAEDDAARREKQRQWRCDGRAESYDE